VVIATTAGVRVVVIMLVARWEEYQDAETKVVLAYVKGVEDGAIFFADDRAKIVLT
jgi:hypothetical protein